MADLRSWKEFRERQGASAGDYFLCSQQANTFVSHALAGGKSLAEVQQAAGHRSVSTTGVYVHTATDDDHAIGNLFNFSDNGNGDPR